MESKKEFRNLADAIACAEAYPVPKEQAKDRIHRDDQPRRRELSPYWNFKCAARDVNAIRQAQVKLDHIKVIHDAFRVSIEKLKQDMHLLIEKL